MEYQNKKNRVRSCFQLEEINLLRIIALQKKCRVNRKIEAIVSMLLNFIQIAHTFCAYLILNNISITQTIAELQNNRFWALLSNISVSSIYFFNLFLIGLLYYASQEEKHGFQIELLKIFMSNFYWIAKLNLLLTAFILYIQFWLGILGMLLASLIFLFRAISLGNFVVKKQENYQASLALSSLFNFGLALNLIVNSIVVHLHELVVFYVWSVFSGLLLMVWFCSGGYKIFNFGLADLSLKIFVTSTLSVNIQFLANLIRSRDIIEFSLLQAVFAFFAIFGFLWVYSNSQLLNWKQIYYYQTSGTIQEIQHRLFLLLEESEGNINHVSLITGLISEHQNSCVNPNCHLNQINSLHPNQSLIVQNSQSYIKYFLKCLYEKSLKDNKSTELRIKYCEFMISQFGYLSTHLIYLNQLLSFDLTLYDRLRVLKLKLILREKSENITSPKFEDKIDLEKVIGFEEDFDFIVQNVNLFCQRKSEIWNKIAGKQINKLEIKISLNQNVETLQQMNQRWKRLSQAMVYKKQWKYYYLLCFLYLNNKRAKVKHTIFQNQFLSQATSLYQNNSSISSINSSIIFDSQSAIIVALLRNQQLVFQQTSKLFSKLTLYSDQEIKGAPLDSILPSELTAVHNRKVIDSLQKGSLTNDQKYKVKLTHFRNKRNQEIPCITFFKLHVNFENANQCCYFIALIRRNTKPVKRQSRQYQVITPTKKDTVEGFSQQYEDSALKLDNSRNIFLKEDILHPAKQNRDISRITWILRCFTLLLILVLAAFCIYKNSQVTQHTTTINTWNTLLGLYRYPIALMINYLRVQMNIGNQANIKASIKQVTQLFIKYEQDKSTNELIFDSSLNSVVQYAPFKANQVNEGIYYDQIDIFYLITSCVLTLSSQQTIKRSSYQFLQLNSYLVPAYDLVLNSTKMFAHQALVGQLGKSTLNQFLYLAVFAAIFFTGSFLYCFLLNKYKKNMARVVKIISNFKAEQAQKLQSYWKDVAQGFQLFHSRFAVTRGKAKSTKVKKQNLQSQDGVQTRDEKAPQKTQKQTQFLLFRYVVIGIMFLQLVVFLTLIAVNYGFVQEMRLFEITGFSIFRYYPSGTLIALAMTQKYSTLLQKKGTNYQYSRFVKAINNAKIMGDSDYLSNQDQDSAFHTKMKNYLYGNPCVFDPSVLKTTQISSNFCVSFSNSILSQGIFAFFRFITPKIQDFLEQKILFKQSEINDIITAFAISGYYIDDLTLTFAHQFQEKLNTMNRTNLVVSLLLASAIILVHVVVFQRWLLGMLHADYTLIKEIYNYLVPEYILVAQKLVKNQFYECGILRASS